ncbi:MAG TPA: YihY/virulence factor BrkB family protein [Egibacteraceae bacterium]|nr:YihY/virulence factor BrkB family protein [Egibacteraceae bacterium]
MTDSNLPPPHPRPGAGAQRPSDIPARGWARALKRAGRSIGEDNLPVLAAAMAFYAMVALFPGLIAALSIYGLVADPARVQQQIAELAGALPADVAQIITEQLQTVAGAGGGALGAGAIGGILAALWSASSGMQGLMSGLTIAYGEEESRGFIRRRGTALVLSLVGILLGLLAIAVIAVVPGLAAALGLDGAVAAALVALSWVVLATLALVALSVIYRYGPDRDRRPSWRWVSWGAAAAALLWLVGSAAFAVYIGRFGDLNETYGTLGGVMVMLLWLFLTGFAVLLGAEIDAAARQQTDRDTTVDVTDSGVQREAEGRASRLER